MLNPKQWEFTQDLATLIIYMIGSGYKPRLAYVLRSKEEAKRLGFENSNHTRYLAADIDLFDKDGKYLSSGDEHKHFGEYWKRLRKDNAWGGDFNDPNHYSKEHNGVR